MPSKLQIKLSWQTISDEVDILATLVGKPKLIVGVSRGGLIPAVMLSHKLGVAFESINYVAYNPQLRVRNQQAVTIEGWKAKFNSDDVLFVDDIMDTGDTYAALLHQGTTLSGSARFRFATLINKNCDRFQAFRNYVMMVPKEVWIQFPWEDIDAPF